MSQKTIVAHIYGKEYTLACDTGQEQHLGKLVSEVNARTLQLEKAVGKLPEPLMLLYTALMIADELHDVKREQFRMKEESATLREQLAQAHTIIDAANASDARLAALEEEVAGNLHAIAGRIDGLAVKLAA